MVLGQGAGGQAEGPLGLPVGEQVRAESSSPARMPSLTLVGLGQA